LFFTFRRGTNECGIGKYCSVATCEKTTGIILPIPTVKPVYKQLSCDVTVTFGPGINGIREFRIEGQFFLQVHIVVHPGKAAQIPGKVRPCF